MGAGMAKRKARRSVSPVAPAPFSDLAEKIRQARQILQTGLEGVGRPHSQKMLRLAELADLLLSNMEKFCAGEITLDKFLELRQQIPESYRTPLPPPQWLPPSLAWSLLDCVHRAEQEHKGAIKDLLGWLKGTCATPRGRPPKPQTYSLGQQAVKLQAKGRSWMQIALKLCLDRGPGHTCSKKCADRIRMAAKAFEPAES